MEEFEEEEEGIGQSKLFVILAIALIGLLVLGLMGIGGVFVIRQNLREQAALAQPSPTLVVKLPNPTATFTPVTPAVINTPAPTPTSTPVLAPGGEAASVGGGTNQGDNAEKNNANQGEQTEGPILKPASTRSPTEGATPGEVPKTGLGGLNAILITLALVAVLFIARRMRMTT